VSDPNIGMPGGGADAERDLEREVDEIRAGGSFLPERVVEFGSRSGVRSVLRLATVIGLSAVLVWVANAAADRLAVTNGIPRTVAAPVPAASLTPFDRVVALIRQKSLSDNIRQASEAGACAQVPVGYSPERAVLALVRQLAPGAKQTDAARTIDQFTGLCSLVLRATAPGHVRLVVSVSAPPPHPAPNTLDAVEVGLENNGPDTTVEYVMENVHTGWVVLIGAVGSAADLPRTVDLAAAADAPGMRW
jgi:hypothetical protein